MKLLINLLIICLLPRTDAAAQSVKAVLVQLNSHQNKISYLLKEGKNQEAKNIAAKTAEMNKNMIADFSKNFSYCPVYYYVDTNANLVRYNQFKGILLTAGGTPVDHPVIGPYDSAYFIIRYGYPEEDASIRTTQGFNIYTIGFTTTDFSPSFFDFKREAVKKDMKYLYVSRKYDIDYYPAAGQIDYIIKKWDKN